MRQEEHIYVAGMQVEQCTQEKAKHTREIKRLNGLLEISTKQAESLRGANEGARLRVQVLAHIDSLIHAQELINNL